MVTPHPAGARYSISMRVLGIIIWKREISSDLELLEALWEGRAGGSRPFCSGGGKQGRSTKNSLHPELWNHWNGKAFKQEFLKPSPTFSFEASNLSAAQFSISCVKPVKTFPQGESSRFAFFPKEFCSQFRATHRTCTTRALPPCAFLLLKQENPFIF